MSNKFCFMAGSSFTVRYNCVAYTVTLISRPGSLETTGKLLRGSTSLTCVQANEFRQLTEAYNICADSMKRGTFKGICLTEKYCKALNFWEIR